MSFKYNPDEVNEVCEGVATFKIVDAKDVDQHNYPLLTKDGNHNIIKLTLRVTDNHGGSALINDNLVSNAAWKVSQLLKAIGRGDWFKSGTLDPSKLINLTGQCNLKSKDYNGKSYMNVASYIAKEQSESVNPPGPAKDDDWDAIPF